jgi:hypothetical protein
MCRRELQQARAPTTFGISLSNLSEHNSMVAFFDLLLVTNIKAQVCYEEGIPLDTKWISAAALYFRKFLPRVAFLVGISTFVKFAKAPQITR